jgi:hypothetical protein
MCKVGSKLLGALCSSSECDVDVREDVFAEKLLEVHAKAYHSRNNSIRQASQRQGMVLECRTYPTITYRPDGIKFLLAFKYNHPSKVKL